MNIIVKTSKGLDILDIGHSDPYGVPHFLLLPFDLKSHLGLIRMLICYKGNHFKVRS